MSTAGVQPRLRYASAARASGSRGRRVCGRAPGPGRALWWTRRAASPESKASRSPHGQGAQGPQSHGVRPVEEVRAALLAAAADPVQRGVDRGQLLLRGRRAVRVVVVRDADDLGREALDEFGGGGTGGDLAERPAGEAEGLSVPRGLVGEDREAERVDPFPGRDRVVGVVRVSGVVAHPEVRVGEHDLEGDVRVVGGVRDGAGRGLGGVLEDGRCLRVVEIGHLDGEGAQVVEVLLGEQPPFVRGHPAAPRHRVGPPPIRLTASARAAETAASST